MDNFLVSIVMPVFNREKFLELAIESIKQQTFTNWELIIVDDGSSDDSFNTAKSLLLDVNQNSKVIKQTNSGPGAARQAGVDLAAGQFIAFYDSDDEWLPEHLSTLINYLKTYPQVDWVYSALTRIDYETREIIAENSFFENQQPKPFLSLNTRKHNILHIFDDDSTARFSIQFGIEACFQCSIIKKDVFNLLKISSHRIGEDRMFITAAIKKGFKLAYVNEVTVRYYIHDSNISDTHPTADVEKRVSKNLQLVASYIDTAKTITNLTREERLILNKKIADELFWGIGYSIYWNNSFRTEAFNYFFKALGYYKNDPTYYKTLFVCSIKWLLRLKK
ncbi:hypothetical protein BM527_13215 [Alteromonas sp. Mex14]|nr:hypothetical protein BM527_13215 [Alteromonas sp. Mex14]